MSKLLCRKFNYIAYMNGRSASQEGRRLLVPHIVEYERDNGPITLEQLEQLEERLRSGN